MIKNLSELAKDLLHRDALAILEEGLQAADPYRAVASHVRLERDAICVRDYCLKSTGDVAALCFGKASIRMCSAIRDLLGDLLKFAVAIAPKDEVENYRGRVKSIELLPGNHPIPGEDTLSSTSKALELVKGLGEGDTLFVLISGGGSALFELPLNPITLEELKELNKLLINSGADITEINAVRKHVSQVKGGRLVSIAYPANVVGLIVSDVVGDPPEFIASGPTAPDTTTFSDAKRVLIRYGIWDKVPGSVRKIIEEGIAGKLPETPKPGDPVFRRVKNFVVASNILSLRAMEKRAKGLGYNPVILTSMMEGEAREVGKFLAGVVKHLRKHQTLGELPLALILGGETTVTVRGRGVGGRNQELALAFAIHARGLKDIVMATLGTDGIDGVSEAAGGIVSGETFEEAIKLGLDPYEYLMNNDSYTLLSRLKRAIVTGRTGTNVNDLCVILIR